MPQISFAPLHINAAATPPTLGPLATGSPPSWSHGGATAHTSSPPIARGPGQLASSSPGPGPSSSGELSRSTSRRKSQGGNAAGGAGASVFLGGEQQGPGRGSILGGTSRRSLAAGSLQPRPGATAEGAQGGGAADVAAAGWEAMRQAVRAGELTAEQVGGWVKLHGAAGVGGAKGVIETVFSSGWCLGRDGSSGEPLRTR